MNMKRSKMHEGPAHNLTESVVNSTLESVIVMSIHHTHEKKTIYTTWAAD